MLKSRFRRLGLLLATLTVVTTTVVATTESSSDAALPCSANETALYLAPHATGSVAAFVFGNTVHILSAFFNDDTLTGSYATYTVSQYQFVGSYVVETAGWYAPGTTQDGIANVSFCY